ncbi:hypothetical protein [Kytococcus sedentarius]|uniref:hypothetical protein n=1 Tax=Kytococcus sedentarius TaxID=1276 RepID=UPI0035BC0220
MNTPAPTDRTTRDWLDELIVELRLRNVRGDAIGDAVTSVESHLAESGETAPEAFGYPREYAASLEFAPSQFTDHTPAAWARTLAPVVTGLIGLTLATDAVPGLRDGHALELSWGRLAMLVLLTLVLVVVARAIGPLLRHPVLGAVALGTLVLALGLLPTLWDATALSVSAVAALVVGIGFLAASVVTAYRQRTQPADPVTDPLTGTDRSDKADPLGLASGLGPWVFVLATAGLGAVAWIWG